MGGWARRDLRHGTLVRGFVLGALFAIGASFFGRSVSLSGVAFASVLTVAAVSAALAGAATAFAERKGLRARLVTPSPHNRPVLLGTALAALVLWLVPALALTMATSDVLNSFAFVACSLLAGCFLGSTSWREAPLAVDSAAR